MKDGIEFALILKQVAYKKWIKFLKESKTNFRLLNGEIMGYTVHVPSSHHFIICRDNNSYNEEKKFINFVYRFLETINEEDYGLLINDKGNKKFIEKGKLETDSIKKICKWS
jgi:hypothetical protein